jgi:hypothetical protein
VVDALAALAAEPELRGVGVIEPAAIAGRPRALLGPSRAVAQG